MTVLDTTTASYALHARLTDGTEGLVPCSDIAEEELSAEIAARISVSLPDAETEAGILLSTLIGLGTQVTLLARWGDAQAYQEVSRGVVEEVTPSDGLGGTFSIVAYDPLRALLANKIDAWFAAGLTPKALIQNLVDTWNIPTGSMDSALESVTLSAQAVRGQSLADCVLKWLQDGFEKGMPRLGARSNKGALEIVRPGANTVVYWIRQGESALRINEKLSIVNLVTRVVVLGSAPNEGAAPLLATLDGASDYGIRQDILYLQGNKTPTEVEEAARHVLEEKGRPKHDRTLETFDIPDVHKLDRIRVSVGTRDGYQIVESVSHSVRDGKMRLELGNVAKAPLDASYTLAETASSYNPEEEAWDATLEGRNASDGELYALAVRAGWTGEDAITAVAVSIAENRSSDPKAVGGPNPGPGPAAGSYDLGLWQINEYWWGARFGGREMLFNARINAQAAYYVWTIQGWNAWTKYRNGDYLRFMGRARVASQHPVSPTWSAEKRETSLSASGASAWTPIDVRGQLPIYQGADAQPWTTRSLGGITGVDLHYTAGEPSQTVEQVAAYQISEAARGQTGAGVPFYTLAYHAFVEKNGSVKLSNSLEKVTWHNAGANHNLSHVGICYSGNSTPNAAQIDGMGRAVAWAQRQVGRTLKVQGHRDTYGTLCPGPTWPSWKGSVEAAAAERV